MKKGVSYSLRPKLTMFNGKSDNGYPPPNSYLPSLKMTQ